MKRRTNPTPSNSTSLKREDLNELIRNEIARSVPQVVRKIAIERTEIFSGPIPSPSACEGYEKVLPGFTERAMSMAEKAQDSDIANTKRSDHFTLYWRLTSLLVAFFLAGGVIGGSILLLFHDKNIAGFSVLIGGVATMIATVLSNKKSKDR
jgi:uncharacterized membrane protein